MSMPSMNFNRRGFNNLRQKNWVLHMMKHTLFVSNKHIIRRIMIFLHNNLVLVSNIIMWEESFQDPLALRPTYLIFREKIRCDAISLVYLTLGFRVVLFSSEVDEVSETDTLF